MGWQYSLPSGQQVHVVAPWVEIQETPFGAVAWRDDETEGGVVVSGLAWFKRRKVLAQQLERMRKGLYKEFSETFKPPSEWVRWWAAKRKQEKVQVLTPEERLERVVGKLEKLASRLEKLLGNDERRLKKLGAKLDALNKHK